MVAREGRLDDAPPVELTEQQQRARRLRNIAIALGLFAMVATFYAATIVKFGPKIMDRPIINVNSK